MQASILDVDALAILTPTGPDVSGWLVQFRRLVSKLQHMGIYSSPDSRGGQFRGGVDALLGNPRLFQADHLTPEGGRAAQTLFNRFGHKQEINEQDLLNTLESQL
ncbi:MAG: hypothetical protein JRH20_26195 [Deltaproteobacteria bacterium]|nr:hypothetical protein [Deltaproteobacteria bacterium]